MSYPRFQHKMAGASRLDGGHMSAKKIAVIVVGSHFAGKSKTINKYLKKRLEISERAYTFYLNDKRGYIVSQTLEESGRELDDFFEKCEDFHYVVVPCRPADERGSHHREVNKKL